MFWQKKRISRAQCPPVESIDDFVEWLLKYCDDFEEFRNHLYLIIYGTVFPFLDS